MGRIRSIRNWLDRLERSSSTVILIPQYNAPPVRTAQEEVSEAFRTAYERFYAIADEREPPSEHPLAEVTRNSPDPLWSESFLAGCDEPEGACRGPFGESERKSLLKRLGCSRAETIRTTAQPIRTRSPTQNSSGTSISSIAQAPQLPPIMLPGPSPCPPIMPP